MAKRSQKDVLNQWLNEHSGILYKVVRAYAFNFHDQEDLFQEIVVQLWRSIPNFRQKAKESTYLYQVALFAAMAWSRKEKRRQENVDKTSENTEHSLLNLHPPKDPRLDWLYDQIAEMPETDRSLTLLLLDGYSYRDIASTLGLSETNVGVRLTRIRKKLTEISQEK